MDFTMVDAGRVGGLTATSMGVTYASHVSAAQVVQQQAVITAQQVANAHQQHTPQQQQHTAQHNNGTVQIQRVTLHQHQQQQQQQQQQQSQQQQAAQQQQVTAVQVAQQQVTIVPQHSASQHHHHHDQESLGHVTAIKVQDLNKDESQAFTPPPRVESVGVMTSHNETRVEKATDNDFNDSLNIKIEIRGSLPGITPPNTEKDKNIPLLLEFHSVPELLQFFSRGAISQPIDAFNLLSPELVRSFNPELVRNHFLYVPNSQDGSAVRVSSNGFTSPTSSQQSASITTVPVMTSVANNAVQLPLGGGKLTTVKQERKRGELPPGTIYHRPPPPDPLANSVFVCWICGLDMQKSLQFEEHMIEQHSIDKPYRCDDCGVTFKRKAHLDRHRRIHLPTRPYQCGICGKGFTRNEHVRRHAYTHSGEKPFNCPTCNRSFGRREHLLKHMASHTKLQLPDCVSSPSPTGTDFSHMSGEYNSLFGVNTPILHNHQPSFKYNNEAAHISEETAQYLLDEIDNDEQQQISRLQLPQDTSVKLVHHSFSGLSDDLSMLVKCDDDDTAKSTLAAAKLPAVEITRKVSKIEKLHKSSKTKSDLPNNEDPSLSSSSNSINNYTINCSLSKNKINVSSVEEKGTESVCSSRDNLQQSSNLTRLVVQADKISQSFSIAPSSIANTGVICASGSILSNDSQGKIEHPVPASIPSSSRVSAFSDASVLQQQQQVNMSVAFSGGSDSLIPLSTILGGSHFVNSSAPQMGSGDAALPFLMTSSPELHLKALQQQQMLLDAGNELLTQMEQQQYKEDKITKAEKDHGKLALLR